METLIEVYVGLLQGQKLSFYIIHFFYVLLGVLISLRIHAEDRNKHSPATPYNFSWRFLLQDNLMRIAGSMAVVFISIQFGKEIFGVEPTYVTSIFLGLSFDQAIALLRKIQIKARE